MYGLPYTVHTEYAVLQTLTKIRYFRIMVSRSKSQTEIFKVQYYICKYQFSQIIKDELTPSGKLLLVTYSPNDVYSGSFHILQSIRIATSQTPNYMVYLFILVVLRSAYVRFYGVMAITLDFESNNPSSNLGRTFPFLSNNFNCVQRSSFNRPCRAFIFRLLPPILVVPLVYYKRHSNMTHYYRLN